MTPFSVLAAAKAVIEQLKSTYWQLNKRYVEKHDIAAGLERELIEAKAELALGASWIATMKRLELPEHFLESYATMKQELREAKVTTKVLTEALKNAQEYYCRYNCYPDEGGCHDRCKEMMKVIKGSV